MRKCTTLAALLAVTLFATGFTWPFPSADGCKDAKKLISELPPNDPKQKETEARVMELCPTGPAGHYLKGLQFERAGSVDAAVAEYRETLRLDPAFYQASGNLGLLHLKKGATEEATAELSAGLKSGDPRYNAGLARIFSDSKLYTLAIYHYGEALTAFPTDAGLHRDLACAFDLSGQKQKAEGEYRKALAFAPGDAKSLFGLGSLLLARGETDQAMKELKQAQVADPNNKAIHRLLAEGYSRKGDKKNMDAELDLAGLTPKPEPEPQVNHIALGDEEQAAKNYEKAISEYKLRLAENPGDIVALQHMGDALLALGREDEAMASYREALRRNADNAQLHFSLGTIYERKALLDEAVVEYRQVLNTTPENDEARERLAEIYTLRGSFQQALEQYRILVKKRPSDASLQLKLARSYVSAKDLPAAADAYAAALKLSPDLLEAHQELASLQRKRNLNDEAAKEYQEVLRLKKDDAEARSALTAIYVKNRNYDDLAKLLKEGVELAPTDPNAHYKLGLVYEFQKNYELAGEQYEEAIKIKPDHAKALNAMGRVQMKSGKIALAKQSLEAAKKADPELEEPTVLLSNIKDELSPEPRSYRKHGKHSKKSKSIKGKKGKSSKQKSSSKSSKSKKGKKSKKKAADE